MRRTQRLLLTTSALSLPQCTRPLTRWLLRPNDFTNGRIEQIASAWVEFNLSYRSQQSAKFQKYAQRLGESLDVGNATGPERILAPYFSVSGRSDLWWEKCNAFYEATLRAADGQIDVTRVMAAKDARALMNIADEPGSDNVCIWVSGLGELSTSSEELAAYANAIRRLDNSGRRSFALYGGFFAIALSAVGLSGCSHGIGYGEHRIWRELPRSGPPPSRYYLPTVHRYASQEDAHLLWLHDTRLVSEVPVGRPISLQYHDLKMHSVAARAQEIEDYGPLDLSATIRRLETELRVFRGRLNAGSPNRLVSRAGITTNSPHPTMARRFEDAVVGRSSLCCQFPPLR